MERNLTVRQWQSILTAISWMQRWVTTNIDECSCLLNRGLHQPSWPRATGRLMKQHRKTNGPDSLLTIDIPDEIIGLLHDFLQYSEEEYLNRELQRSFEVDGPSGGFRTLDAFKTASRFSEWTTPHSDIREILQTTR